MKTAKVASAKNGSSETIERTADSMTISLPKTRINTLEQLIDQFEIDTSKWEVERFVANKWEVGVNDGTGKVNVEPLFQVKAFLKTRLITKLARQEIELLKKHALIEVPKMNLMGPRGPIVRDNEGNMLEVSFNDHHFGKLAWGEETGSADYDTSIASEIMDDAASKIVGRCREPFSRVNFVIGHDLLNIDNLDGTTTAGTRQDVDTRYQKVFWKSREVIRQAIERFRQVAPVHVLTVPGNHDTLSAWHMGDSLDCLYTGNKYVTVDASANHRKYIYWGDSIIMCVHGDRVRKRAETLSQVMYAETQGYVARWREVHCGHFHKVEAEEIAGVKVRVLPSLCASDYFHHKSAYLDGSRSSEAYLWNKEEGLIGIINYNIPARFEKRVVE